MNHQPGMYSVGCSFEIHGNEARLPIKDSTNYKRSQPLCIVLTSNPLTSADLGCIVPETRHLSFKIQTGVCEVRVECGWITLTLPALYGFSSTSILGSGNSVGGVRLDYSHFNDQVQIQLSGLGNSVGVVRLDDPHFNCQVQFQLSVLGNSAGGVWLDDLHFNCQVQFQLSILGNSAGGVRLDDPHFTSTLSLPHESGPGYG
ncbi:hypothetical protein LWI28_000914 [Acer negundo]|uniref:Uncharacterized protein n=1 Tax=Acer negundo TaxID=4023 RepID=A0AAD5JH63_ACENE|nr:hypothetical protein LWI28_000914 [Acer negundo]